jgi:hypothetical protein
MLQMEFSSYPSPFPQPPPSNSQRVSPQGLALFLSEVTLRTGPPFSSGSVHAGEEQRVLPLLLGQPSWHRPQATSELSISRGNTDVLQLQILFLEIPWVFCVSPSVLLPQSLRPELCRSSPERAQQVGMGAEGPERVAHLCSAPPMILFSLGHLKTDPLPAPWPLPPTLSPIHSSFPPCLPVVGLSSFMLA